MKPTTLLAAVLTASALPAYAQNPPAPPAPPAPPPAPPPPAEAETHRTESRIIVRETDDGNGPVRIVEIHNPDGNAVEEHMFAGPMDDLARVTRDLAGRLDLQTVGGTYLGVSTTPVPSGISEHLSIPPSTGLLVQSVADDSPAAKAGFEAHDILTKLDDQILVNPEQLAVLVSNREPGAEVRVSYLRKGEAKEVAVTLGKREPGTAESGTAEDIRHKLRSFGAPETMLRRFELAPGKRRNGEVAETIRKARREIAKAIRSAKPDGDEAKDKAEAGKSDAKDAVRRQLEAALKALQD